MFEYKTINGKNRLHGRARSGFNIYFFQLTLMATEVYALKFYRCESDEKQPQGQHLSISMATWAALVPDYYV
jgi:hypothetical protein